MTDSKQIISSLLAVADGSDNADLCVQAAELLQRWSDPSQLWWVDIEKSPGAFMRHGGEVRIVLGNAFGPDEDHPDFISKMPVIELVTGLRREVDKQRAVNAGLLEALRDCRDVMERDLDGLKVIQPELKNAKAAIAKAKDAVTNQQASKDQSTWCQYVAGMVGGWLEFEVDDPRIKTMGEIIERRLWALKPSKTREESSADELRIARAAIRELEAKVFSQEQALAVLRTSVDSYHRDMSNPPGYLQDVVIKAAGLGAMAEQIAALKATANRVQPERKPLTDGRIAGLVKLASLGIPRIGLLEPGGAPSNFSRTLARAIERAHGIGTE